jgi:uncharacterized coiled-coil DUF342 family protein
MLNKGGSAMNATGEIDQFQLLEKKVDNLIELIADLRKEKKVLTEKVQIQDKEIGDLSKELKDLKSTRDKAKQRIVHLLEKIEQIDI